MVDSLSSKSGRGKPLIAADGGVFAFGDAAFRGGTGNIKLNGTISGAARTLGLGYWMVASDGGGFAFGDATFRGAASVGGSSTAMVDISAR